MPINQARVDTLGAEQRTRYDQLINRGKNNKARRFLQAQTPDWQAGGTVTETPQTWPEGQDPGRGGGSENPMPLVDNEVVDGGMTNPPTDTTTNPTTTPETTGGVDNKYTTTDVGLATNVPTLNTTPTIEAPGPIEFTMPTAPTAITGGESKIDFSQFTAPQGEVSTYTPPDIDSLKKNFSSSLTASPEDYAKLGNEKFAMAERQRIEREMYDKFQRRMAPQFEQESQSLSQELVNRGIPVGSELHNRMLSELRQSQGDRRLDAQTQAMQFAGEEQTRLSKLNEAEKLAHIQASSSESVAAGQAMTKLEGLALELKENMKIANLDSESKLQTQKMIGLVDETLANLRSTNEANIANLTSETQWGTTAAQIGSNIAISEKESELKTNLANLQAQTDVDLAQLGIFADAAAQEGNWNFLRGENESDRDLQVRLAEMNEALQLNLQDNELAWAREEMLSSQRFARIMSKLDHANAVQLAKIGASGNRAQYRDYMAELNASFSHDKQMQDDIQAHELEVLAATGEIDVDNGGGPF